MVKKEKVVKGMVEFPVDFSGRYFDPLIQNQQIHGVFVGSREVESKFKNSREESDNFGKKKKTNYEIKTQSGSIIFGEGGGPLQSFLDGLEVGQYVEIGYLCMKLPDGTLCPKTIKTREQLYKWRGGKKESSFPKFEYLRAEKKGKK